LYFKQFVIWMFLTEPHLHVLAKYSRIYHQALTLGS